MVCLLFLVFDRFVISITYLLLWRWDYGKFFLVGIFVFMVEGIYCFSRFIFFYWKSRRLVGCFFSCFGVRCCLLLLCIGFVSFRRFLGVRFRRVKRLLLVCF